MRMKQFLLNLKSLCLNLRLIWNSRKRKTIKKLQKKGKRNGLKNEPKAKACLN